MMKIQNPHDKFFKETFSNMEVVKDFIQHYLPPDIVNLLDLDTIQPKKDSFINDELKEQFSDILFQLNIHKEKGYLYLLFEHKSFVSKDISLQLLKYIVEIWQSNLTKENRGYLPIVIPLVIYHGRESWQIHSSLGEMMEGYAELPKEVKKYIPNYEYILYDISNYRDEDIRGVAQLKILLTIFRDIVTKEQDVLKKSIQHSLEYLLELEDQSTAIQYFETFIRYIFHASGELTNDDFHDIIEHVEKTYPEGSELVMTLAERFQEKGRKQGIEQGIEQGIAKTAIKLIAKYVAPVPEDVKNKIYQQEINTLDRIIDHIDEFETIEEVERLLK